MSRSTRGDEPVDVGSWTLRAVSSKAVLVERVLGWVRPNASTPDAWLLWPAGSAASPVAGQRVERWIPMSAIHGDSEIYGVGTDGAKQLTGASGRLVLRRWFVEARARAGASR